MRSLLSILALTGLTVVTAEKWYLSRFSMPATKTLTVEHFFTVYKDDTPEIKLDQVQLSRTVEKDAGLQLSVIHHRDFAKLSGGGICSKVFGSEFQVSFYR